jgi:hypothetical protein
MQFATAEFPAALVLLWTTYDVAVCLSHISAVIVTDVTIFLFFIISHCAELQQMISMSHSYIYTIGSAT